MDRTKYFRVLLVGALICFMQSFSFGQSNLEKPINVHVTNVPLEAALQEVESACSCYFSYPSDILGPAEIVSVNVQNKPVKVVLEQLLQDDYKYKELGSYIIIQQRNTPKKEKKNFNVSGSLVDASSGKKLSNVTLYEVSSDKASLSNPDGTYDVNWKNNSDHIDVLISKENYRDTIVRLSRSEIKDLVIELQPIEDKVSLNKEKSVVDSQLLVQMLLSEKRLTLANNVLAQQKRLAQVSFLPSLGTNGFMSGKTTNYLSLNLLAGYAHSLKGLEVGGLANILRYHSTGIQVSGLVNLVGGRTTGIQVAGFSNNSKMRLYGVQFAGFTNSVSSEAYGVQLSGFANFASSMRGIQVATFLNSAWIQSYALQVSAGVNVSKENLGGQVAALVNVSTKKQVGLQFAGLVNYGNLVQGSQFASFINVASKEITGVQVAGFLNFANRVNGIQIGLINVVDTLESGVSIGLLNFVRSGIHDLEINTSDVMPVSVLFKTGVDHFYNIIGAGYHFDYPIYTVGYGMGTRHISRHGLMFGAEVLGNLVLTKKKEDGPLNVLGQGVPFVGFQWGDIALTGGPVFNVYYSKYNVETHSYGYPILKSPIYDETDIDGNVKMSIGYRVGISF